MDQIIGIDLGGTQLRAVLSDASGAIHQQLRIATDADDGPEAVINRLVYCINQMRAHLPIGSTLRGVGVGAPGPIDPVAGLVFTFPNLPGWHDVPLRAILEQRTGLHVKLGNDANVAALGEWRFGGGVGKRNLVYITISTGIGGGVIEENRLALGYKGAAGELGHMLIDAEHLHSWEDLASGTALARAAASAMQHNVTSLLHQLATPETMTAAEVAAAAAQGDALAQHLMQREGYLIGVGLVTTLHMYSPEIILLGGSVVTLNPWLLDIAREVVQRRAIAQVYRDIPIEVARLGDKVGLLGAVALWM